MAKTHRARRKRGRSMQTPPARHVTAPPAGLYEPRSPGDTPRKGRTNLEWTPDDRAQWLFEFLRTDLSACTDGQQLDICTDATRFVPPIDHLSADVSGSVDDLGRPTFLALVALQREAKERIKRVREGDYFDIERGLGWGWRRLGGRLVRHYRTRDFWLAFLATVGDTLEMAWKKLRECMHCKALFLRHGKLKFCSPACARRARWETYKQRHPDRQRDYREEYEQRVRQRLGPAVTVTIRPRKKADAPPGDVR